MEHVYTTYLNIKERMIFMSENWKYLSEINGYEKHKDVQISDLGNVKGNDASGKEVKITTGKQRPKLHLKNIASEKDTPPVDVHTLVAKLFIEKPVLSDFEVHHIDEDPKNNNVSNLVWLTKSQHDKIHGR